MQITGLEKPLRCAHFYLLVDLLCRCLPGKFVCTDVQTRALQHLLFPLRIMWLDVSFRIMQILETLYAYRGEFDPSAR